MMEEEPPTMAAAPRSISRSITSSSRASFTCFGGGSVEEWEGEVGIFRGWDFCSGF